MSDFETVEPGMPAPPRARRAGLGAMAGGAVSAGLILGLGVWAYALVVRDTQGVPVVRALEGPLREAPEDPGGVEVAHQGFKVNEVAAGGVAAEPPEQVVLAPRPVSLAPEDLPTATLRAEPALAAPAPEGAADPIIAALIAAGVGGALQPAVAALPDVPAPRPRPVSLQRAAAPGPAAPAAVEDIAAATLAQGSAIVQIGAYESPEMARAEWLRLASLHGSVMSGKARLVEPAGPEAAPFFRLRAAGFADLADARRFCAVLMAGGADCVPVVTR